MSSKPTAVFAYTPSKQVRSSPARPESGRTAKMYQATPNLPPTSPRKYKIETEIQSSANGAARNASVKLRVESSPKVVSSSRSTKPSPRKNTSSNENIKISKTQTPNAKNNALTAANSRNTTAAPNIVKSMRSCFEPKETRVVSNRPPPSPSPSRPRTRPVEHPITPKSNNVRSCLSARSRYQSPSTLRPPSAGNTPVTKPPAKLRRSASASSLLKSAGVNIERDSTLKRASSQTLTPTKPRVKFQDEATPECFSPVLLETKGEHGSGESLSGEVTNLTVGVRVRPLFHGERSAVAVEGNTVKAKVMGLEHTFTYEYCFHAAASQAELFTTMVRPLVDVAFQGYNVCLFAYGQTGTGKTYSMMGEEVSSPSSWVIAETAGIIPRFCQELFKIIEGSEEYSHTKVELSYFEIYNEKIHDLLGPSQSGRSAPLRVREHPELGPYVVDLTVHNVHSFEILMEWVKVGNSHRETAATEMNMNSSRSHSIFTLTLTQSQAEDRPSLCSKINLIDLAGSERLTHTCATGDRLKEGVSINRSLLTLGKVISSLAENKKRGFIPYRESVLTWLLRESLGGNSRTAMLATISPSHNCVEESLSTLRYACQARNIVNTVRINESPHEKRIRELNEEIQRLKDGLDIQDHEDCLRKQKSIQTQLNQATEELTQMNFLRMEAETEVKTLKKELSDNNYHEACERQVLQLQTDLIETSDWITNYEGLIKNLKSEINDLKKSSQNDNRFNSLEKEVETIHQENQSHQQKIDLLEKENDDYQNTIKQLGKEINHLEEELVQAQNKNLKYEKDIDEIKELMNEIKYNNNHDSCDSQILMLQTALSEAERSLSNYKEKVKNLEKKPNELSKVSNHDGCEKEIVALKCTISELKTFSDHDKCEEVIEKLKTALEEAESLVNELENENKELKKTNSSLELDKEQLQKEIVLKRKSVEIAKSQNLHLECEERIDTLKKALVVAKSRNVHIECEKKISELQSEIVNLQSVTIADHTRCEERANNLFYAIEKYAEENTQLLDNHKTNVEQYKETIRDLEEQISKLTALGKKSRRSLCPEVNQLETQVKILKEENSRIKKKRVDDESKVTSLEEQVISLTKELLDVKSQLRATVREKESCNSLCSQLQEQLSQQDRKLEVTRVKPVDRCSLVMKAEEIHQAVKDAEDICTRLKIPWVFHIEPEVTTHSWFDVNLRVWDQRTMSSVRWPREVFLNWLQEMKDEIMTKSGGQKLFQCAQWLKRTKGASDQTSDSGSANKTTNLQENEISGLQNQIATLERLCKSKKHEDTGNILNMISDLKKSVSQLKSKPALSPLALSSNLRR